MPLPIALQLYTVRDELAEDTDRALGQIAEAGYQNVELAGLHGHTPEQFKHLLEKHGLTAIASHDQIDNIDLAISNAGILGYQYVVCPYLAEELRQSYGPVRDKLLAFQAEVKGSGLTVCYHNHDFEWLPADDGRRAIDVLFEGTELHSELDVFWVTYAEDSPVEWINKLAGRVPLVHIKDMTNPTEKKFAEVGTGCMDFKPIIDAAEKAAAKYLIVEQDSNWKTDQIDSARTSLENLRKLLA